MGLMISSVDKVSTDPTAQGVPNSSDRRQYSGFVVRASGSDFANNYRGTLIIESWWVPNCLSMCMLLLLLVAWFHLLCSQVTEF